MTDAPLETERLVLEPLRAAHAAALFAPLSDPSLYRFIPQDPPASIEALAARYARLEARSSPDGTQAWLNWAARRAGGGGFVGLVEATVHPERRADLAWFVFAAHQRRGYAREACARVVEHLAAAHGVALVAATVDARNEASLALAASLGLVRVGFTPGAARFKGATSDEVRLERRLDEARAP